MPTPPRREMRLSAEFIQNGEATGRRSYRRQGAEAARTVAVNVEG